MEETLAWQDRVVQKITCELANEQLLGYYAKEVLAIFDLWTSS